MVGAADLSVSSIDYMVSYAVDPLGFNDYSTTAKPAVTIELEYWTGTTWSSITNAGASIYSSVGIVMSGDPCMKTGSFDATLKSYTLSCVNKLIWGITSAGKDVF